MNGLSGARVLLLDDEPSEALPVRNKGNRSLERSSCWIRTRQVFCIPEPGRSYLIDQRWLCHNPPLHPLPPRVENTLLHAAQTAVRRLYLNLQFLNEGD